jgi:hypothetical protein
MVANGRPAVPSPINPEEPVNYEHIRCWLKKAEQLAKVPK